MAKLQVPRHVQGKEGDILLWPRASELDFHHRTVGGPELVAVMDSLYGPDPAEDHPDTGWYTVRRAPLQDSPEELLEQAMGYDRMDVYVTMTGLHRALDRWPGPVTELRY